MEKRVIRDENGSYRAQVRFPSENEWRTFYISAVESNALEQIGASVEDPGEEAHS